MCSSYHLDLKIYLIVYVSLPVDEPIRRGLSAFVCFEFFVYPVRQPGDRVHG